jgi:hypothetical protein
MTATGVRGLLAITFITLMVFIYITALLFAPFAQGSLSYGSAIILGTPIIFLFNSIGLNVTVTAAALSFLFPLGDCLPPSRIVGRLTVETVGYEGSYMSFLKAIAIPWLFMGAIGLLMLIFPNRWISLWCIDGGEVMLVFLDTIIHYFYFVMTGFFAILLLKISSREKTQRADIRYSLLIRYHGLHTQGNRN